MKRVAPILLLAALACDSSSPDRTSLTMPPAATQPSAAVVPLGIELYSDEFCKGGNAWWNARFNIFGGGSLEGSEIRVYTIDVFGARKLFGVAKAGVPELEGTDFSFYAEGIAPPDSIPDLHDVGYPPNYGFVPFAFDVYAGSHHELVGAGLAYSDIPLTSNLYPHACQGIKSRTGCVYVCCPTNISSSDYQVGGDWFWQIGGDFITGPCTNPTLRLKVYFLAPGGKKTLFGFGEAGAIDEFGGHRFVLVAKAPALDLGALPNPWLAKFRVEVSSKGTPVGRFDLEAPGPLTPNPRNRVTRSPTTPGAALSRAAECELQGGGVDGNGEVFPTAHKHRSAIRVEGIFTICSEETDGTWFKVYSYIDNGTAAGHRILLAADHDPVVLRQVSNSSGTLTSWQVNIDFVPTSMPLVEPNGFQPRVLVEAYGQGGKIGEVFCYLDDSPDVGPRGPHRRAD